MTALIIYVLVVVLLVVIFNVVIFNPPFSGNQGDTCYFRHKWGKYGESYTVKQDKYKSIGGFWVYSCTEERKYQKRICKRCELESETQIAYEQYNKNLS